MRILVSGPAAAFDAESEEEITDVSLLARLSGFVVPDFACADYVDDPAFDSIDLIGGRIETAFDPAHGFRVVTEYRSPEALSDEELAALAAYTEGQWSDGAGEDGIDVTIDGRRVLISVSPISADIDVVVEQLAEESPPKARFRKLFAAARHGDVAALAAAIAEGEQLNCRKGGMSALQWAISFGHVETALLLIACGADVAAIDAIGDSVLTCCAATRDLSDDDAVRIAELVLRHGAGVQMSHREKALEIANLRGKQRLAKLLMENLT